MVKGGGTKFSMASGECMRSNNASTERTMIFVAADPKKSGWHHRREKNDPTKDPTGSPTHES